MQHFIVKWRRPRKVALLPELNTYPETPAGFLTGFYPGSKRVEGYKVAFNVKLQTTPILNSYPQAAVANQYPAWATRPTKLIKTVISFKTAPELNSYPQAVLVSPYPSWLTRPVKKVKLRFSLQSLPELNEFRQVGSPYPSWLAKKTNKAEFRQKHLTVEELDFYPQIVLSPALLPAFIAPKQFRSKHRVRKVEHALFAFVAPAAPVSIRIGTRYNIDFFVHDRNIAFDTDERALTFNAEDREILL